MMGVICAPLQAVVVDMMAAISMVLWGVLLTEASRAISNLVLEVAAEDHIIAVILALQVVVTGVERIEVDEGVREGWEVSVPE